MTGLELFYEEASKRDYIIGETDISKGESNGDFFISNRSGMSKKLNYKDLAIIYGTFAFYHCEPQEAINQIFEIIEISMHNTE